MTTVDPNTPVIIVSKAGFGITYVRWYPDVWSAERNHVMMTVTRTGISVHTKYLEEIPDPWLEKAKQVRAILAENPEANVEEVATHKHSAVANGPLVVVGNE